jgi:ISXO2-like transposase domain
MPLRSKRPYHRSQARKSGVHTNTIEGFFSVFKCGMKGVYQHCGHNHLNRYLAELDFRYSNSYRARRR